jgi:Ala-tRNA(Pro) deacylase
MQAAHDSGSVFERLVALLEAHQARFRIIEHPAEGRSDIVAALRGTKPGQGAKAMLCRSEGVYVLAVLPGDRKVDFKKVAQVAGKRKATLATPEEAMKQTGCAIGAIPPFSLSPHIQLAVDPALVEANEEIAFNAGRLDRSMVLDAKDYLRIAQPLLRPLGA